MYDEYLAHYGVRGMKWRHRKAVRRLNQARRNQLDQELEIKELERMERQEKAERSGEARAEKNAPNPNLFLIKRKKKKYNPPITSKEEKYLLDKDPKAKSLKGQSIRGRIYAELAINNNTVKKLNAIASQPKKSVGPFLKKKKKSNSK